MHVHIYFCIYIYTSDPYTNECMHPHPGEIADSFAFACAVRHVFAVAYFVSRNKLMHTIA